MSYTNLESIKQLEGKNVLFFDLETSGIPTECKNGAKPEEEYANYDNNKCYDNSRIVQVGWIYVKKFKFGADMSADDVKCELVNPEDFVIPEDAIKIHKITNEYAKQNGRKIKDILNDGFTQKIKKCDYIVGYNVFFDVNILLNELHRKKFGGTIEKIEDLIANKKVMCVGQLLRQPFMNAYGDNYFKKPYSISAQRTIYKRLFNKTLDGAHDAKNDIMATSEIMNFIVANPVIEKNEKIGGGENCGTAWYQKENDQLCKELKDGLNIYKIAEIHGRTVGGIKSQCKKLNIDLTITYIKDEQPNNSRVLIEKLNQLIDKNMANYKLTGKNIVSENNLYETIKLFKT